MDWLLVLTALLAWLGGLGILSAVYRADLYRLWREPVFKRPVLVLESDDWGAGPLDQVAALDAIAAVLRPHRDADGRPPVLSLAIVLAVPDGRAIASEGVYRRVDLGQPLLAPVREALCRGEAEGVFSLQLHGLEHFWPSSLMASDSDDVRRWRCSPEPALTEALPAPLQSRWIDAARLPSRPLRHEAIEQAVAEEVLTYARVFGQAPRVVVPPTFVWTPEVERAWAAHGVECVVTPGCRYTGRDGAGASVADRARFANGDRQGRLTYLVRSDYFEPIKGRDAAYALRALQRARDEGRACLLENHRINFCRDADACRYSLDELDQLVSGALRAMPDLRFLSSAALLGVLNARDAEWISTSRRERLRCWWRRLQGTGRLWKLLRLSGAAFVGNLLLRPLPRPCFTGHG